MDPAYFFHEIVDPSLKTLSRWLTKPMDDDRARVLVMAICGQESNWQHRLQIGGPARGYPQFEGGPLSGTAQVFKHAGPHIKAVCDNLDIPCDEATVFTAMAWNDALAICMARLLLWTDPRPLPDVGARDSAWNYYIANWHPGAPHPETWPQRYATAMTLINP